MGRAQHNCYLNAWKFDPGSGKKYDRFLFYELRKKCYGVFYSLGRWTENLYLKAL